MFFQTLPTNDLHVAEWVDQVVRGTFYPASPTVPTPPWVSDSSSPQRRLNAAAQNSGTMSTIDTTARRRTEDPLHHASPFIRLTQSEEEHEITSPPLTGMEAINWLGIPMTVPGDEYMHVQAFTTQPPPDLHSDEDLVPGHPVQLFARLEKMEIEEPDVPSCTLPPAVKSPPPLTRERVMVAVAKAPPQIFQEPVMAAKSPPQIPQEAPNAFAKPQQATSRRVSQKKRPTRRHSQRRGKCKTASARTVTGVNTSQKLLPSQREVYNATSSRAKLALETWYERLNELNDYKMRTGHCNVPQKWDENSKLGIVGTLCVPTQRVFACRLTDHDPFSLRTFVSSG
jgi:hypothetical protein